MVPQSNFEVNLFHNELRKCMDCNTNNDFWPKTGEWTSEKHKKVIHLNRENFL